MRIVNQFNRNKKSGIQAEEYLIKSLFPSLNLSFEKIPESNKKTPEGWIIDNKQKIALAEIKLIQHADESQYRCSNGSIKIHEITIHNTIEKAISRAKEQLSNIHTKLPKILYLVLDDSFANARSVIYGAFGPRVEVFISGKRTYSGLRGFYPQAKMQQDNKILGDWISAIFCYLQDTNGYKLIIFRKQDGIKIPQKLMPMENINEIWEYSDHSISKIYS